MRGVQITPEYGHEYGLVNVGLLREMDRAMEPTLWEKVLGFWRRMQRGLN
jgi:hypothetical protein